MIESKDKEVEDNSIHFRAVRIVPNDSPVANLANLYGQQPPAIQSTKLVTRPVTVVTTVSTDVTTPLTVTLGAREILTEIVEPTTTVTIMSSLILLPHDIIQTVLNS